MYAFPLIPGNAISFYRSVCWIERENGMGACPFGHLCPMEMDSLGTFFIIFTM